MTLITEYAEAKWSLRQKNFYINHGYKYTNLGDVFSVKIIHLSPSSRASIEVQCDYCSKVFTSNYKKRNRLLDDSEIKKDSCSSCRGHKIAETRRARKEKDPSSKDGILIESSLINRMSSIGFNLIDYSKPLNTKSFVTVQCKKHPEWEERRKLQTLENEDFLSCSVCRKEESLSMLIQENIDHLNEMGILITGFDNDKVDKRACTFHYKCSNGHNSSSRFYFIDKFGCQECYKRTKTSKKRIYYNKEYLKQKSKNDSIEIFFQKNDYYTNENILIKCIKHDIDYRTIKTKNIIRSNFNCKKCSDEAIAGENHYLWKGGVSPVQSHLRGDLSEWKKRSLKAYSKKCFITESKSNLVVHHIHPFAQIVDEVLQTLGLEYRQSIGDYSLKEQHEMVALNIHLHEKYAPGIPLREDVHNLFHDLYGKKNNTMSQLLEFKENYLGGAYFGRIPS